MRLTRNATLAAALALLAGCSWFSWLPWVDGDKKDGEESLKPAPLVKFDPEVRIDKQWGASVGKGLGRKYLRMQPAIVADRVYSADGYGRVEARNRFLRTSGFPHSRHGKARGPGVVAGQGLLCGL